MDVAFTGHTFDALPAFPPERASRDPNVELILL
jgi:hypothetical protein